MEKLNSWLNLIANLGVLAGIAFLAYEIQINTNAVKGATYQSFNESSFSWADSQLEYAAELAAIYESEGYENLTPEQKLLWDGFQHKWITVMETNYLQHRAGVMDDDLFESKMSGSMLGLFGEGRGWWLGNWIDRQVPVLPEFKTYMDKRIRSYWEQSKSNYDPVYAQWVDQQLAE